MFWVVGPTEVDCFPSVVRIYKEMQIQEIASCVPYPELDVQSTDHELIPARNASLAAMQGSASGSNVRYYLT
jgi:predicted aconitase